MTPPLAPQWLHQRTLGRGGSSSSSFVKQARVCLESVRRLKLEAHLDGHQGCVNCLQWNQSGTLLASGSDDCTVILWDPFKRLKRHVVRTSHLGNIFSVNFIPQHSDHQVATCASDRQVTLLNIEQNKELLACRWCHADRVKRLASHPSEPHLFWSAGEDGFILQYDTREQHKCASPRPKNMLINLNELPSQTDSRFEFRNVRHNILQAQRCHGGILAKCLALNPLKSEMLAVGASDMYTRLFDRRYPCLAPTYFAPGHASHRDQRSFGATYLTFSQDGSELLVNVHAEQIYLYNVYEPWERYKSFEDTIKPLIMTQTSPSSQPKRPRTRSYSLWRELRRTSQPVEIPEKYQEFCENISSQLAKSPSYKPALSEVNKINELLNEHKNCPQLYRLRSKILRRRRWWGDHYAALRDDCCALALNPLSFSTLNDITIASRSYVDKTSASKLSEFLSLVEREFSSGSTVLSTRDCNRGDLPIGSFDRNSDNEALMSCALDRAAPQVTEPDSAPRESSHGAFDYSKRFCGHCNMTTDIKEANFLGDDFVVAGGDDGAYYIWDKTTTNLVKAVRGDLQILNCLQPHPSVCLLATSGIEPTVKLWSPIGDINRDLDLLDARCYRNQNFLSSGDPLEARLMMTYPMPNNDQQS